MKKVIFGKELQKVLSSTMTLMSSAVQSTLGPSGKLALLDKGKSQGGLITKDGVTLCRNLLPIPDPSMNVIGSKILEICTKTNAEAGDGTTTAIVLAKALYEHSRQLIEQQGANPLLIKQEIEEYLPKILEQLDSMAIPVDTFEDMVNVASISANNDIGVGTVVAKALDKVGEDGYTVIEEGDSLEPKFTMVEGFEIEKGVGHIGYLQGSGTVRYQNPYILVYGGRIDDPQVIVNIVTSYCNGRPLVIVGDVSGNITQMLLQNLGAGAFECVQIPPPMYKATRQKYMRDIAIAVGAEVIDPNLQHPTSISKEQLGESDSISCTQWRTNIVGGRSEKEKIFQRIDEIKDEMSVAPSEYDKNICKERIGRLTSGVCIISVGGKTEQEMIERKHRFEDSVNALRAALQEGIIPGGGHAFLSISKKIKPKNTGQEVLKVAIQEPFKQIVRNTGIDPEEILSQVKSKRGYDAREHKFCNLVKKGIIDPVRVTKLALQNAVSVVDLLINLEVLSYEVADSRHLDVLEKLSQVNGEDI